jgi:hypothetical protein
MIEADEKFPHELLLMISRETNSNISEEIGFYLKERIKNKGISNCLEYIAYSAVLANRIGEEEYFRMFQHLLIPAGLMNEEDKIKGVYLN